MKTIIDYTNLIKGYFAGASNLAPVEVSPSANAYAIGEPLMYDGKLYLAKTAIAVDDALVVDTNIEAADDIMTQLAAKANIASLGTAAAKDSTNEITQSSTDLVESGAVYAALADKADKPTVLTQALAANATTATFTGIPTTGDYLVDFFISDGTNYTALDISTPGTAVLTYDASASARTVFCRIEGV